MFPLIRGVASACAQVTPSRLMGFVHQTSKTLIPNRLAHSTYRDNDWLTLPRVSWSSLNKEKLLGEGCSGKTYKGIFKKLDFTEMPVSIKMPKGDACFIKEGATLHELDKAGGAPQLIGMTREEPVSLVMSYIPGLELHRFLPTCSEHHAEILVSKIKEAVKAFHDKGFVHGDLHSSNIIINNTNGENTVHLIDVGLAAKISKASWLAVSQDFCDLESLIKNIYCFYHPGSPKF